MHEYMYVCMYRRKLLDDLKERRGCMYVCIAGSYWMTLRKGEDTLI